MPPIVDPTIPKELDFDHPDPNNAVFQKIKRVHQLQQEMHYYPKADYTIKLKSRTAANEMTTLWSKVSAIEQRAISAEDRNQVLEGDLWRDALIVHERAHDDFTNTGDEIRRLEKKHAEEMDVLKQQFDDQMDAMKGQMNEKLSDLEKASERRLGGYAGRSITGPQ